MSILSRIIARFFTLRPQSRNDASPERLSLREWADLPAYHPRCD